MKNKISVFSCFFIMFISHIFSQESKEYVDFDPQKIYTQKFIDSLISDPTIRLRMSHYKKMLESDESLFGWPHYYYGMASLMSREMHYDSVIKFANKGIEAYENAKTKRPIDEKTLIPIYFFKGRAYKNKNDSYKAISAYLKGLELTKIHYYKWHSYMNYDIANTYLRLDNNELALKHYLKCLKDSLFLSREGYRLYSNLGKLYGYKEELDSSLLFYNKSLKKGIELKDYGGMQKCYLEIGNNHVKLRNKDSAIYYFDKAYNNKHKVGDSFFMLEKNLSLKTDVYTSYKYLNIDPKRVIAIVKPKLDSVYQHIDGKKTKVEYDLFLTMNSYLLSAYNNLGNYEMVIKSLELETDLLKRINKQLQEERVAQLEIQYQTKEKEASIAQLEENKTQQEQIIKQQRIIGFSLGGLLLAFAGFGYLFWRQRKLKDQYEKENLEQRLLRSQMNPHFIGNAMNVVSSLVEKKSSDAIPFINKLSNLFRLILTNSREEFVSLDEELQTIKGYLDLQTKFVDQLDYQITVNEAIDQEEVIVSPMLIQPLVENAIKHGLMQTEREKLIEINISVDNDSKLLLVEVKDNGVGMVGKSSSQIKKGSSVSGDVIRERLQILKKRFKVNARINYLNLEQGTKVELYLPYLLDE